MIDNSFESDYKDILKRNYKDVPNKSISATEPKNGNISMDFMKSSENFWITHEGGKYYQTYKEGILAGTFNTSLPTFDSITDTILEGLKNVLRIQCEVEDKTSEEFSAYFDLLDNAFELLRNKADKTLDKRLEGEMMMAYFHAIFNAFITTNIRQANG